ncbi:MAG: helix-turn-helix transcriptional regulator [Ignavibacteriaceae bacterium]
MSKKNTISLFVKEKRKKLDLTQNELAERAGVGLRFIRELEQGKETLQLNKVNQVLQLFGYQTGPVKKIFKE